MATTVKEGIFTIHVTCAQNDPDNAVPDQLMFEDCLSYRDEVLLEVRAVVNHAGDHIYINKADAAELGKALIKWSAQ